MKTTMIRTAVLASTLALMLTACGSSDSSTGGGGGTTDMTAAQQAQATQMIQSMTSSIGTVDSMTPDEGPDAMVVEKEVLSVDCNVSGSITIDSETMIIEWDECVVTVDDTTTTTNGSISLTQSGDTYTMTWSDDFSVSETDASGTDTFTMSGTVSMTDQTVTINISSTFDDDAFTMVGEMTNGTNAAGHATIDGTVTITVSTFTATCVFDELDIATATQADYDSACGF
jgi:hypothetical protein